MSVYVFGKDIRAFIPHVMLAQTSLHEEGFTLWFLKESFSFGTKYLPPVGLKDFFPSHSSFNHFVIMFITEKCQIYVVYSFTKARDVYKQMFISVSSAKSTLVKVGLLISYAAMALLWDM